MDFFEISAMAGSFLMLIFLIMDFFGFSDTETDVELGSEADGFFKWLSIKNMCYFAALGGWSAIYSQSLLDSKVFSSFFFLVGGSFGVMLNITLMYFLNKLKSEPKFDPKLFKGAQAVCTITIQPHSPGLVHATVNGKLQEYVARSDENISVGEPCIVRRYINNSVEVYTEKGE
jgi:hypothetical protein